MRVTGIETPTLIERFIKLLPLPYPLAALAWAAVFGSPGFLVLHGLATGSPIVPTDLSGIAINLLFFLLPLYLFLMVNYLRRKVVSAESQIEGRLAGGEEDYHKAFGPMMRTLPLVPITAVLAVVVFPVVTESCALVDGDLDQFSVLSPEGNRLPRCRVHLSVTRQAPTAYRLLRKLW